jgi:16S rRNA (cytosine1402-N4)-methyltransferase
MLSASLHIPVLLNESIDGLAIVAGDTIVDGTFGGGGHSKLIIERFGESVQLVCVDLDEAAGERYRELFGTQSNTTFVHANFKDVQTILDAVGKTSVNRVLLDLGTSTFQLLADTRGFSFHSDAPLSMAFSAAGAHTGISAWDIANLWEEETIADIIYAYGEDRSSRRIARAIVAARESGPIDTASALATVIASAFSRRGRIHPATKTFQAFRIAVNDELTVLKDALAAWWQVLAPGGRIAVITFHSLEDRIVKQWMKAQTNERVITKKPLSATAQELQANPRSRSAKLRIIEKTIEPQ